MMWKSLEQEQAKSKTKTKEAESLMSYDIKPFKITRDKNFYYVVKLGMNEFILTKTEENAVRSIQTFKQHFTLRWPYPSVEKLREQQPDVFESIRPALRRFSAPSEELMDTSFRPYNKNYMSTLNDGRVEIYTKISKTTAVHITEGLVFLNGTLYMPYRRENVGDINSADSLRRLVQSAPAMDWSSKNIAFAFTNRVINAELVRLTRIAETGEVGVMDQKIEDEIEILLHGDEMRQRKQVLREALTKLDKMVGFHRFKQDINNLMIAQKADKRLKAAGIKPQSNGYHTLMLGPAGTGKTEVARLYAEILYGLGIIQENKMTELSKEDLVDVHIGGTEEKTKKIIEEAIGGMLFVDEAYTLVNNANNGNDYGKIALDILMRYMENHRNEFVAVFAGYEMEMENLLDANQGIRSRVNRRFYFDDYSLGELTQIFTYMVEKEGYTLEKSDEMIERVLKKDLKDGVLPGNARSVRKYVSDLFEHHKMAVAEGETNDPAVIPVAMVQKLTVRKQTRDEETMKLMQERAVAKLNGMIGLDSLKDEIRTWTNMMKITKRRQELGMESEPVSLHMTYKGAPGTGKTTVARIIGELLKSNGLLSRGHFKEVGRADLVAGYTGQTAPKVQKLFKEMEGGVLFIDEAYSLVQGEHDQFGKEAVDTLIAEMENRRDDLVVILAGYEKEIDKLFQANPGFVSRVPNHFYFPDYTAKELFQLLLVQTSAQDLVLTEAAKRKMAELIVREKQQGNVDGNGRWVRNQVERLKKHQSNRLAEQDDYSDVALRTIQESDVQ